MHEPGSTVPIFTYKRCGNIHTVPLASNVYNITLQFMIFIYCCIWPLTTAIGSFGCLNRLIPLYCNVKIWPYRSYVLQNKQTTNIDGASSKTITRMSGLHFPISQQKMKNLLCTFQPTGHKQLLPLNCYFQKDVFKRYLSTFQKLAKIKFHAKAKMSHVQVCDSILLNILQWKTIQSIKISTVTKTQCRPIPWTKTI